MNFYRIQGYPVYSIHGLDFKFKHYGSAVRLATSVDLARIRCVRIEEL